MRLTPLGKKEILVATVLCWGASGLIALAAIRVNIFIIAAVDLPLLVWLFVLYFFRDPHRTTPTGSGLFISPADGRVADITPLGPESALKRDGVQIGVFMSVFSVHVNRMPCDGLVKQVTHLPGAFMDVRNPIAAEKNESTTIEMTFAHDGVEYPVILRQIAGLVARRIVTCCKPGDRLSRGERFGMIKFGSRLELLLPNELAGEICVKIGQNVRAGQTILAAINKV